MADWWATTFPQGRQTIRIPDANGTPVNIAYGEVGSGQPLVLVHGVGVWSHYWRHNIPALSQHFRVITFDAKGCGFSDRPLAPELVGHQVIELARILEALCDRPAILVAESLGALTTLALASEHAPLVDRMVVINVPIFPKELPSWGMKLLSNVPLDLVKTVDFFRVPKTFGPLTQWVAAIARRDVVVDPAMITLDDVYWATYPYMEYPYTLTKLAEDLQIGLQQINYLIEGKPSYIRDIQHGLSAVQAPTLILWSEQDTWFPVADGYQLHQALPNATLQIIPNCGHQAAAGRPDFVNAAILSFLADE
ncbi:MAG: alpha/beta hydrolase [Leptolyngbyaceae bacterium]|nr:alpha/beta hydrolase [Leptolyngbyaceae bacterium]